MAFDSEGGEGTTLRFSIPTNVVFFAILDVITDTDIALQGVLCHRSDLYEELKRLAIGEGEGPPPELRLGAKVVACDPEEGTISLSNGEVIHADFVLGADGINVSTRLLLLT